MDIWFCNFLFFFFLQYAKLDTWNDTKITKFNTRRILYTPKYYRQHKSIPNIPQNSIHKLKKFLRTDKEKLEDLVLQKKYKNIFSVMVNHRTHNLIELHRLKKRLSFPFWKIINILLEIIIHFFYKQHFFIKLKYTTKLNIYDKHISEPH